LREKRDSGGPISAPPTAAGTPRFWFTDGDKIGPLTKKSDTLPTYATQDQVDKNKSKSKRKTINDRLDDANIEIETDNLPENKHRQERSRDAVLMVRKFFDEKTTDEEKVKICKALIDSDYITTNTDNPDQKGRKIYFNADKLTPGIRKQFAEYTDARHMWDFMYNNTELDDTFPKLDTYSSSRRVAAYTGRVHEAGTAVALRNIYDLESDPEDTEFSDVSKKFQNAGGKMSTMEQINRNSAIKIKKYLDDRFKGKKVKSVRVVGTSLSASGNAKKDPTDLVVELEDGTLIRISMKAGNNPSSINIKNSGIGAVGKLIFNDEKLQNEFEEINDNDGKGWDFSDPDQKEEYKQKVHDVLFNKLKNMTQDELKDLWKEIHGCNSVDENGNPIELIHVIGNKKTSNVELRDENHYCSDENIPAPIIIDGSKKSLRITAGNSDKSKSVQIETKIEQSYGNSGVFIFNHKERVG
jgi:hypothetical protein